MPVRQFLTLGRFSTLLEGTRSRLRRVEGPPIHADDVLVPLCVLASQEVKANRKHAFVGPFLGTCGMLR